MEKLYFTIDELSERWRISTSQIGELGAAGMLQFGVYIAGALRVEIGRYGPAPNFEFLVESAGVWANQFVPVTKNTVAACWQNGGTFRIEIPNTDDGKIVHVVGHIPYDESDLEAKLLICDEEVKKFEASHVFSPETPKETEGSKAYAPQNGWSRGLKLLAWNEAVALSKRGEAVSANSLICAMQKHDDIDFDEKTNKLSFNKQKNINMPRGERSVCLDTVKNAWASKLKKMLTE